MAKTLVIYLRLHDHRYNGIGDWPPSPSRLFQALLASAGINDRVEEICDALAWLEKEDPPIIGTPHARRGQPVTLYLPNNDMDKVGGDPRKALKIRTATKTFWPWLLESDDPFIYAWRNISDDHVTHALAIQSLSEHLYQFGRGVDMAWAWAKLVNDEELEQEIKSYSGRILRPASTFSSETSLRCPQSGYLFSLLKRHKTYQNRFSYTQDKRSIRVSYTKPPSVETTRFRSIIYNPTERWQLYDLRRTSNGELFFSWSLNKALTLIEQVRDKAAQRMKEALHEQADIIDRLLIGRNADADDKQRRVRLIPVPSIGHEHADSSIRRLLVSVPSTCPLPFDDIAWAFSGLTLDTQSTDGMTLVAADDISMLRHYALESSESCRIWHSVTPVALSLNAKQHTDPKSEAAKTGSARAAKEEQARIAVRNALRHAGLRIRVDAIHVQREPFFKNGARADTFATGRFQKKDLWHVKIHFARPAEGMMVIGNGRYLGLGLMAPHKQAISVLAYHIEEGLAAEARPDELTHALRRAVMARVQSHLGSQPLPSFITGHDEDGQPMRRGDHQHLAFVADLPRQRLLVIPPHTLEQREPYQEEKEKYLPSLDAAMEGFSSLCAGHAGKLSLSQAIQSDRDPLLGSARCWESLSPYKPTRHAKHLNPEDALCDNILCEIQRQQLPRPEIEVLSLKPGPRGGLEGRLRLLFKREQSGPILLGRTRHFGGGLFQAMPHKA